ncbi:MAG: DPP IV N-terminal domain-containing protein [Bacteroidales bacterium]
MKKHILFPFLLFILTGPAAGQGKLFTMEEAVLGGYGALSPARLRQLQWRSPDTFTWVENDTVYESSVNGSGKTVAFTLEDLNRMLGRRKLEEVSGIPRFEWEGPNIIAFRTSSVFCRADMTGEKVLSVINIPQDAGTVEMAPGGQVMAWTRGNQLYVDHAGGKRVRISTDSIDGVVYGQSVHRNEFGISGGLFFSPSGKSLAFYRKDERNVTEYPIVNFMTRVATPEPVRYPMAGMDSEVVKVGVYHAETDEILYLETGEPAVQYLTNLAWTPDEKYILVAHLNREQNHMQMKLYDASDGSFVKTLFEECDERYVEPQHPALFLPGSSTRFVWQSRRDGYNHLYLYDLQEGFIHQITRGEWEVTRLLGFGRKGGNVYFEATEAGPLERQVYTVSTAGGRLKRLTAEPGTHQALLNADGTWFLDTWSNIDTPLVTALTGTGNRKGRILKKSDNPLKEYALGDIEVGSITAGDGVTPLYYRLIKPVPFDPEKKYPVVVYVYGGPHAQLVTNGWLAQSGLWPHYMAQRGYTVFTLDNRGSANRGMDFESIIHRRLGETEVEDQMRGIEWLKTHSWVDTARMGVHGWSYGGFMTLSLMLRHPGVFKVGVAGGPVTDWKFYEVMYGERYMDTPDENPEGYARSDLKSLAGDLRGRLLLIHGALDDVVVWQHSLTFLRACIQAGTQPDYFVYPTHPHNIRGSDRVHLMNKISDYFDDFLK